VATIWRILKRHGQVKPQPRSGPRAPSFASRLTCPTRCGKAT
jgi:hypothetical protein